MRKNLITELINALQECKSRATTNPAELYIALWFWSSAEGYESSAISIHSKTGKKTLDLLYSIIDNYSDTFLLDADNSACRTTLLYFSYSLKCIGVSRMALLLCIASHWDDLKRIPEIYDVLITLAESLKYYEEQIPNYERVIRRLKATCKYKAQEELHE